MIPRSYRIHYSFYTILSFWEDIRFSIMPHKKKVLLYRQNNRIYSILSFIIPAIYRLLLELFSLFPVGYDTNVAYILRILLLQEGIITYKNIISEAPLYYFVLYLLTLITGDLLNSIKILAIILSGTFGFSLYLFYSEFDGTLSPRETFEATLLTFFYFTVLRITWDLHRNLLGLILVFLAVSIMRRNKYIAYFLSFLSGFSHQFSFPIISAILLPRIFKKEKDAILTSISAGFAFSIVLYFNILSLFNQIVIFRPSFNRPIYPSGIFLFIFMLWAYGPLAPFLIPSLLKIIKEKKINYKKIKNPEIISFILVTFLISTFIVLGFRLIIIATIPSVYITFKLSKNKTKFKILIYILAINFTISPLIDGLSIYPIPHKDMSSWGPPGMLMGSTFYKDMQAAEQILKYSKNILKGNTVLVLPEQFISVAYKTQILMNKSFKIYIKTAYSKVDLLIYYLLSKYEIVYILWFNLNASYFWMRFFNMTLKDLYSIPQGYKVIKIVDRMALYLYTSKYYNLSQNVLTL